MGLFTTPLVINDGVADRTFDYRGPIPGFVGGEYVEPAESSAVASKLLSKHAVNTTVARHLLSRKSNVIVPDVTPSVYSGITLNFTATLDPRITLAQVTPEFELLKEALIETDFLKRFLLSYV